MPQGSSPSFKHHPLHHESDIRLLRLSSGLRIQGELFSCPLESAPYFVALSYTWGDCGAGDHDLNSCEEFLFTSGETLRISHNLASWIHIHGIHVGSPVWIDQICIDQLNFSEREAQVRLMVDIYRRASKLYAWLGPGNASTTSALQTIDQAGRVLTPIKYDQGYSMLPEDYFTSGFPRPDRAWEDVRSLFENRTWFTRVWVQQEIIVSNLEEIRLQCGTKTIKWAHVEVLAQALSDGTARLNSDLRDQVLKAVSQASSATTKLAGLSNLSVFRESDPKRSNKVSILTNFRGYGATDSPNYSLSLEKVYTSVMVFLIENHGIEVLFHAGLMNERHHAIPSWVVDWSFQRSPINDFEGIDTHAQVAASNSSSIFRVENDRLSLKGFLRDSVRALSHPLKEIPSSIQYNEEGARSLLSWYYDVLEVAMSCPFEDTESDLYDRIWTIITYSSPLGFRYFSDYYDKAIEYLELLKVYDFNKEQFDQRSNGQELESITERLRILYYLGQNARGRRFCVTRNGQFGLVPEQANIGDVLFSILDQELALVGRPVGGECHLLVGNASLEVLESESDESSETGGYDIVVFV